MSNKWAEEFNKEYFFDWELTEDDNFLCLISKYIVNNKNTKIKIKARKGAILIERTI